MPLPISTLTRCAGTKGDFSSGFSDGVCLPFKARGARIVTPVPVFHDRDRIVARSQRVSSLSPLTYDRKGLVPSGEDAG